VGGHRWRWIMGVEPALNGWTIELYKYDEGITDWVYVSSAITGDGAWPDGYYEFTVLSEGEYRIQEITKLGWTQTHPTGPNYYLETVEEGITYGPHYFGNYEIPDFVIPEAPFGTLLILVAMVVAYLVNNKQMIPLTK
jgi:hypothetical protein